jgi:Icc-related predicted phosphoesterase
MSHNPDRLRVVALSDTHGCTPIYPHHEAIENADLVIFAGDFAKFGHHSYSEFNVLLGQLKNMGRPTAQRIFVPGNHDYAISPRRSKGLREAGYSGQVVNRPAPTKHNSYAAQYVRMAHHANVKVADKVTTLHGKMWFASNAKMVDIAIGVVPFLRMPTDHWGWYKTEAQIERLLENLNPMGRELALLISHAPPAGALDYLGGTWNVNIGSVALRDGAVGAWAPSVHIFGHVHTQGGQTCLIGEPGAQTQCLNVACVDDDYKLVRGPTTFDMVRDGDRWRVESYLVHPMT